MYYKCPYCDNRVRTRKEPCKYCGGASSAFVVVYEEEDFRDKSSSSKEKEINKIHEMLRYVSIACTVLGLIVPSVGVIFSLLVIVTTLIWKDIFFTGKGKVSFWVSVVRVTGTVILYAAALLIAVFFWDLI